MVEKITSAQNLMFQAPDTIAEYLSGAVKFIDTQFGKGYAAANPELTAAFIKAATMDFATAILAQRLDNLCNALEEHNRDID